MSQKEKASENLAMLMSKEDAFKDRQLFVRNLGELLAQTREGVIDCELDENEIIWVHFVGGHTKRVNVDMDSYTAIIRDVMKYAF